MTGFYKNEVNRSLVLLDTVSLTMKVKILNRLIKDIVLSRSKQEIKIDDFCPACEEGTQCYNHRKTFWLAIGAIATV